MLRQVLIFKDGERIYEQLFGKSLDEDSFQSVLKTIFKETAKKSGENVSSYDFFKYRMTYLSDSTQNIIFMFVSDLTDKFELIQKELYKCKKEFMLMFEDVLTHKFDNKTFEIFDPTIESIHKNMRPKISLVGFSGVGKTTLTRLIRAEEIPTEHVPTITGDIATIKIGNLHFHLWDFAGQEQFSFLWNNFVKGSDAVLLITDSSLENCEKSRFFIELINKECPNTHQAIIGNKQDLPEALPVADIERLLNLKTYSMVATDPENRNKMITIIADILDMSSEVSPLLAPLIERDEKLAQAEMAIENGDFLTAIKLFEQVADLSIKLGDDVVSQEFHQKSLKIRKILDSVGGAETAKPEQQIKPVLSKPTITPPPTPKNQQLTPDKPPSPPSLATPKPKITPPQIKPELSQPPNPPPIGENKPLKLNVPPIKPLTVTPPAPNLNDSNLEEIQKLMKGLDDSGLNIEPKLPKSEILNPPLNGQLQSKQILPANPPPSIKSPQVQPPPINNLPTAKSLPPKVTKSSDEQLRELNSQIMDLKIKITNVKKNLMDLEMDNIMGNLSDEQFQQKSGKLKEMEKRIQSQIDDLEKLRP